MRHSLGEELRQKRLDAGLTQAEVAAATGLARCSYVRIEGGTRAATSLEDVLVVAAVLGLDLSTRLFPGAEPLRDAGQARKLARLIEAVAAPLEIRTEVPLPRTAERPELRAWDAMISGSNRRTAIEVEMRLGDAQAVERRHALKRRDDPVDGFLLVVAASRHNRRVLLEHDTLFPDLPRLDPRTVLSAVRAGRHPPPGLVLL